jgi:hypothetical protein
MSLVIYPSYPNSNIHRAAAPSPPGALPQVTSSSHTHSNSIWSCLHMVSFPWDLFNHLPRVTRLYIMCQQRLGQDRKQRRVSTHYTVTVWTLGTLFISYQIGEHLLYCSPVSVHTHVYCKFALTNESLSKITFMNPVDQSQLRFLGI